MDESLLKKLALLSALGGIIAIVLLTYYIEIPLSSLSNLTTDGQTYKIKAEISQIRTTNTTAFLGLKESCTADAVLFNADEIYLKKGDTVELIGKLDTAQGKKTVIADYVKVIRD